MASHTYKLESNYLGEWRKLKEGSLQYLQGYLDASKDASPALPPVQANCSCRTWAIE